MQLITLGALIATTAGVYAIDGSGKRAIATIHIEMFKLSIIEGTFFEPGLGACGVTNSPNDFVVAVPPAVFSSGSVSPPFANICLITDRLLIRLAARASMFSVCSVI
jgi:hypothetical protein